MKLIFDGIEITPTQMIPQPEFTYEQNNKGLYDLIGKGNGGASDGGSGASAELLTPIKVTSPIGNIPSGAEYGTGTKLEKLWHDALEKELPPSVSLSMTPSTSLYETGTTIEKITLTATVTEKSNSLSKVEFYKGSTLIDSANVSQSGNVSVIVENVTSNTTFKCVVTDDKGLSANATKSVSFAPKQYYGIKEFDESLSDKNLMVTVDNITSLPSYLKTDRGCVIANFTLNYGNVYYAYPKSLGELTYISDGMFDYISTFVHSTLKINNVDYYVYCFDLNLGFSSAVTYTFR